MRENKPDTKALILNAALRLFAASGVENVSMRDLADDVGIKAASIYNHFPSKDEIVEACYDYYLQYHDAGRLNKEQYSLVLLEGTKEEIVNIPIEQFPEDLAENMFYAMIVLFSRIYTDSAAIIKYTQMIDHSMEFLMEFLDLGIKLGRFDNFIVRGVSMLMLSSRLFAAQSVTIHPEALSDWDIAQKEMTSELMNIIPFRY